VEPAQKEKAPMLFPPLLSPAIPSLKSYLLRRGDWHLPVQACCEKRVDEVSSWVCQYHVTASPNRLSATSSVKVRQFYAGGIIAAVKEHT
jgi:hypothetical protein